MTLFGRLFRQAKAEAAAAKASGASRRGERGAVAIMIALTAVVLLGMVSLGVEVTAVLMKHQQMQSAADAAAVAGAVALAASSPSGYEMEARAVAGQDGFVDGVNAMTVTVKSPPVVSRTWAGNAAAVEVVISQPQILPIAAIIYHGDWSVSARGVASVGNSASSCVLSLDPSTGVVITGGVLVNLNQCGLASNATGASALSVSGGATLNAGSVTVSGATSVYGGAHLNAPVIKQNQPATTDPYAGVAVPPWSGCTKGSAGHPYTPGYKGSSMSPGVYCGGLTLDGGGTNTMSPGVYFINGGVFQIGNGASLTGTGVTIVLTGSGNNYATVAINGGSPVNLTAPTTGPTAGLVFFEDPKAPSGKTDTISNGATVTVVGAMYFPTRTVSYGGGTKTGSPCTQLVAWRVTFTNGAWFNNNCASTGVASLGASSSKLVE